MGYGVAISQASNKLFLTKLTHSRDSVVTIRNGLSKISNRMKTETLTAAGASALLGYQQAATEIAPQRLRAP